MSVDSFKSNNRLIYCKVKASSKDITEAATKAVEMCFKNLGFFLQKNVKTSKVQILGFYT